MHLDPHFEWVASELRCLIQITNFPGQTVMIEHIHEWIRIHLLHIKNTPTLPYSLDHKSCTYHSWHSGGVTNCLTTDLTEALLVIAHIKKVFRNGLPRFFPSHNVSYTGLSLGTLTQSSRIWKHSFQKLQRYNFMPLVHDWLNGSKSDILKYFQMLKICITKSHPKASFLDFRKVLHQG